MGFISVTKVYETFNAFIFKFLQLLVLVRVELRQWLSLWTFSEREEYTTVQKRKTRREERVINRYTRYYPPIIGREQYDRCREVAQKNNNNVDKSKNVYYAAKLIRCNSCGSFLVACKHSLQYQCQEKYVIGSKKNCQGTDRININVIDSLLWHLAKRKEADFYTEEADKQIAENETKKNELQSKTDSIEKRKKTLWNKHRKLVIKMFPRKTESEINRLTDDAMKDEIREMEADRVAWTNEIDRLRKMTDEMVQRNTSFEVDAALREQTVELRRGIGLDTASDKVDRFAERFMRGMKYQLQIKPMLDRIEDEQVIYAMVHRHIKVVQVENVPDVDRPEISVKKITVRYYTGRNDVLYYHPKAFNKERSVYRIQRQVGYLPGGKNTVDFGYKVRFERKPLKN